MENKYNLNNNNFIKEDNLNTDIYHDKYHRYLWSKTANILESNSKYGGAIGIAKKPHDGMISKDRYNLNKQRQYASEIIQPRIDFTKNPLDFIEPQHFKYSQNKQIRKIQKQDTETRFNKLNNFVNDIDETIKELNNPMFFYYKGSLFK